MRIENKLNEDTVIERWGQQAETKKTRKQEMTEWCTLDGKAWQMKMEIAASSNWVAKETNINIFYVNFMCFPTRFI